MRRLDLRNWFHKPERSGRVFTMRAKACVVKTFERQNVITDFVLLNALV